MKQLAFASSTILALVPSYVMAATQVYPGCTVPTIKAGHHTFYVDPVKGSAYGDGSAAKPWRTLADVLNSPARLLSTQSHKQQGGTDALQTVNSSSPIKAGDVIMLMSGNHGNVKIQNAFNQDFITVMAAPGQTPVISSLIVQSSQNWMFQGVKIEPGSGAMGSIAIAALGYGDWIGTTNNIIIDNSTVATVDDSSAWSADDWMKLPKQLGIWLNGSSNCLAATNNHVLNVLNGIALNSSKSLVQGNTIERMRTDGIDVTASDVAIKGNTIVNGANTLQSQEHADGIQGWSPIVNGVTQTVSNVLIDSNKLIKTGDGYKTYMQGISIFDGKWNNLSVINNSVAVNTWNGIVIRGADNSSIVNNTVVGTDSQFQPRIQVGGSDANKSPSNITVRNNITSDLITETSKAAADHNIADHAITVYSQSTITSGTVGSGNKIVNNITGGFVSFNRSTSTYDLRIRNGSAAVAAGNSASAPPVDIIGKARSKPADVGAYNH